MDACQLCPCGSRRSYAECCRPFHQGADPSTALELMRSRFSAFALRLPDHLLRTWDRATRPERIDLEDGVTWRRLQIVDTARGGPGDVEGIVHFRASYRTASGAAVLEERSRFRREGGRWVYVDGEIVES